MDEAAYWSERIRPRLTRECQQAGLRFHFERIENVVSDGTPDVDYLIASVAGKVELKYTPAHPVRDTSQVLGNQHGMRRSQIVYAARHIWAGGLCWCLIGTPEADWLIDLRPLTPAQMADLSVSSPSQLARVSAWQRYRREESPTLLADVLRAT